MKQTRSRSLTKEKKGANFGVYSLVDMVPISNRGGLERKQKKEETADRKTQASIKKIQREKKQKTK